MEGYPAGGEPRGPLHAGEWVVLVDDKGHRHLFQLVSGGRFHTNRGGVRHDDIIGREAGARLKTALGRPVLVVRPSLEEYIMNMPRKTQIIYPKDLGFLVLRGNVFPGARVLQTGLGSGSLGCTLLRCLGPEGELVSYEERAEFARLGQDNIRRFLGSDPPNHRVEVRDAYAGDWDVADLDTVFLDLPEPERCVAAAAGALRPGGTLVAWLPTTLQVHRLVVALRQEPRFDLIETLELLQRPWYVTEVSMRPEHRMVAHTGFIVSACRCAPRSGRPVESPDGGADGGRGDGNENGAV